jgi:hypothetical protein
LAFMHTFIDEASSIWFYTEEFKKMGHFQKHYLQNCYVWIHMKVCEKLMFIWLGLEEMRVTFVTTVPAIHSNLWNTGACIRP